MQTAVSQPADHFSLNVLAGQLAGFRPPPGPFDPRADAQLAYGVYTLAGRAGRAGKLRIGRKAVAADRLTLDVDYEKFLPGGARQRVTAKMHCRSDKLSTPLRWTFTAEIRRAGGEPTANTRVQKRAAYRNGQVEIADAAARRRISAGDAYTINWALFDAVGRLPREQSEPLRFTLFDHFDQLKRNQTLSLRATADVRFGGNPVRLHAFAHLGDGIVPWIYWAIKGKQLVPEKLPFPQLAGRLPELPPNHRSRPPAPKVLDTKVYRGFSAAQWRYYIYVYYRQVEMVDADLGRMAENLKDTSHLVSGLDVMGTFCDYAGIRSPAGSWGRSLRPLLEGQPAPWREFLVTDRHIVGRMVRTPQYKYVRYQDDPIEQLFDVRADPWEMKNVYDDPQHADTIAAHRKLLAEWQSRLKPVPPMPDASRPRRTRPQR